ncbi:hypothetical protein NMG60_11013249 [Bertholletia excelsa]
MAKSLTLAVVVALVAALLHATSAQEVHVVGDSLGWIVPPGGSVAYRVWADTQTFTAGDILLFNFTTGNQDVARVSKEAFDSCNATNPIWISTTGPVNFTLTYGGAYYFIGTMDKHCSLGQKLAINVTGASGPTTSPAPVTPAPASPRAPVTYVVGGDLGWIVPPGGSIAYATWAYGKTFMVGDTLVFKFTNGTQDVAVVTKSAYDSCDTSTTITILTTSPAKVSLTTTGEHYFTSTYSKHCDLGQKLAINVVGTSGTSSAPAPEPGSTLSEAEIAESPTTPPPAANSAHSTALAGIFGTAFASLIVAFLA